MLNNKNVMLVLFIGGGSSMELNVGEEQQEGDVGLLERLIQDEVWCSDFGAGPVADSV